MIPIAVGIFGAYAPISASADPAILEWAQGSSATYDSTVTASGGSGVYTYAWVRTSGSSSTATPTNAATTTFTGPTSGVESWRCTVTDVATGATATANVSLERLSGGG